MSISSKNRIPNINPIAAGKNANFPIPSDMSMDGISSDHTDAASPVGMKVTCNTTLVEVDKRRLVFSVEVEDETGKVGEGTHERFIVQAEKFQNKADAKLNR